MLISGGLLCFELSTLKARGVPVRPTLGQIYFINVIFKYFSCGQKKESVGLRFGDHLELKLMVLTEQEIRMASFKFQAFGA